MIGYNSLDSWEKSQIEAVLFVMKFLKFRKLLVVKIKLPLIRATT